MSQHMVPIAPVKAITPSADSKIQRSFAEADGPLGAAIRAIRRDVNIRPVSSELQQSAWKHLRAIEALCHASTREQMLAWIVRLAPGVVNPPTDPRDLQQRTEAIWDLCSDLPCAVWCDETRRRWLRNPEHGKFWPSAGELFNLLEGFAASLRADKAGCERILTVASETPSGGDWEAPTEIQREAVASLMQAWRADKADSQSSMEQTSDQRTKPTLSALHHSDETLLELYEAQARDAMMPEMRELGRIRAAALRVKLGRQTPVHVENTEVSSDAVR